MYWIMSLFLENKDAILALPTEVKTVIVGVIVISLLSGVIRSVANVIKLGIIAFIAYAAAVYLGII